MCKILKLWLFDEYFCKIKLISVEGNFVVFILKSLFNELEVLFDNLK